MAVALSARHKDQAAIQAHCGMLLNSLQQPSEAADCLTRAHELVPNDHGIQFALLKVLVNLRRFAEALPISTELIAIDPTNIELLDHHVICLANQNFLSEAISFSKRRLLISRNEAVILNYYGLLRRDDVCLAHDFLAEYSAEFPSLNIKRNLAESALYCDHLPEVQVVQHHIESANAFKEQFPRISLNSRNSKKISVGFISGDFREHAVDYFCRHLIENLGRSGFEVFVYSTTDRSDSVTEQYAKLPNYRDFSPSTDFSKNLETIKRDNLDLLIDLGGMSNSSRPDYVACHPARKVVSAIGYPMASPLAMQLGDAFADDGNTEVLLLERPFLCYDYGAPLPPLPQDGRTGILTFGSFNASEKLTDTTFKLWAQALEDVGECKLILKPNFSPGPRILRHINESFSSNVSVEILTSVASHADHLQRIAAVDVALDSFPYTGTTTTIECLLMGTPVVSLAGTNHRSRVSGSILTATGHGDWIANDPKEFAHIVQRLVQSLPSRPEVRDSLLNSPLMDTKDYAEKFGKLIKQLVDA